MPTRREAPLDLAAMQDWILDGLPRTRGQATSLDRLLDNIGTPLNLVISLQVPDEVILERIEGQGGS